MHATTTNSPPDHETTETPAGPSHVRWVFPAPLVTALEGTRVVGRDESCDTVLTGTQTSRSHAELRAEGSAVTIRDLDSSNGVFVNGVRCTEAPLAVGAVVRCGEWIGVVVAEGRNPLDFGEIAPGWFGGNILRAAVEPVMRMSAPLPMVVQGETGTGKEGLARAAHAWSGRSGPFLAVNCAALPLELAEAELFGYRKGAFTGASAASPGLFRAADGGTIFLDEILELPPALQAKLLRVLEDRRVRGLGDTQEVPFDARVIAATQSSLGTAVAEQRFRQDLHARLDGLTVVLPPLRTRREDVAPLFLEFVRQQTGGRLPAIDARLIETLCLYDWPLNVRELQLLTRRLMGVHGHARVLKKSHLPDRLVMVAGAGSDPGLAAALSRQPRRPTGDEEEFEALIAALRAHGGSVAKAAAAINVSRARVYRLLSAHPDFSLESTRR